MDKTSKAAEILANLRKQNPSEACEAAFLYLKETHRDSEKRFRLINPDSGAHVLNFDANGNRYRILTPADGVGLRRFAALRAHISRVGFDASLMEQFAQLRMIEQAFNKAEYVKAAAGIYDMMQAINKAQRTYPYAAEACALFILREGEETKEMPSQADIESKVSDWEAEGIHEQDFFFLCLQWAQEWNAELSDFSLLLQGRG